MQLFTTIRLKGRIFLLINIKFPKKNSSLIFIIHGSNVFFSIIHIKYKVQKYLLTQENEKDQISLINIIFYVISRYNFQYFLSFFLIIQRLFVFFYTSAANRIIAHESITI